MGKCATSARHGRRQGGQVVGCLLVYARRASEEVEEERTLIVSVYAGKTTAATGSEDGL